MDQALEGHRRYLMVSREMCARNPLVHSHQLAALDREIGLAAAARDITNYRIASGDSFELTRAAWLDRIANQARVAELVDDGWSVQACGVEYAHAAEATGHDDWQDRLTAGAALAAPISARGSEAGIFFTRLLLGLIRLREEGRTPQKTDVTTATIDAYGSLRAADPGFTWSSVAKRPYYALRTPWTGPGFDAIGEWMVEFCGDQAMLDQSDPDTTSLAAMRAMAGAEARWRSALPHRQHLPHLPAGNVSLHLNDPPQADFAAPYRALAEAMTGDGRAQAAIRQAAISLVAAADAAASPQDAIARFVTDGLLAGLASAALRAQAEDGLARQPVWPDPLVEHHQRSLLEHLAQTRTATEVDLVAAHANVCFSVEADWNALFLSSLFGPLRAACTFGAEESAVVRENFHKSVAATGSLLGLGPRHLLAVPRVADFITGVLIPLAPNGGMNQGAFRGEGGFDFLFEAQTWVEMARAKSGLQAFDPTAAADSLQGLCDRAGIVDPRPSPLPVTLWKSFIPMENLVGGLGRPPRPPIPGMTF